MADAPAFALRARHDDRSRCPYCHDLLGGGAQVERVTCDTCGTGHHRACLEELGRCATLGCGGEAEGDLEALRERVRRHAEARERAAVFDLEGARLLRPEPDRRADLAALARQGREELVRFALLAGCVAGLVALVVALLALSAGPS